MNSQRRRILLGLAVLVLASRAMAGTSKTAADDAELRVSLTASARAALDRLGLADGFFANPAVRIGLPRKFARADSLLRQLGYGDQVDALILAMNRAAEAAMPQARPLVFAALEGMVVVDARAILAGGVDAPADYFRRATQAELKEKLLPIIQGNTENCGLTRAYAELAASLMDLAGLKSELATVEKYVSSKTADGIYTLVAEEARALRTNPARHAARVSDKVFQRCTESRPSRAFATPMKT